MVGRLPTNIGEMGSVPGPGGPTYCGKTEPLYYNYRNPFTLEPVVRNKRSHCKEEPTHHKQRKPMGSKEPKQPQINK